MLPVVFGCIFLGGCKATGSIKGKKTEPDGTIIEGEIKGSVETNNFMLTARSLLATAGVFTDGDFEDFDPASFYLNISEEESTTSVENNIITLTVWDFGNVVGERQFATQKSGTRVYFRDTGAVKNWSAQFVDIGDKLSYKLKLRTTTDSSSVVNVSSNQDNFQVASTSFIATAVTTCGAVACKQ